MNTRNLIIKHDDCAESPRDWDNLGTLYAPHRTYRLSDEHAEDIRNDAGNIPIAIYTSMSTCMSTEVLR